MIIDGRIADLIEGRFIEGIVIVPRFVLQELQLIADSTDPARRARGRRGLDMLNRIQRNPRYEVKVHDADFPEERGRRWTDSLLAMSYDQPRWRQLMDLEGLKRWIKPDQAILEGYRVLFEAVEKQELAL